MSKSNFFNTYTSTNGSEVETQSAITRNNIETGLVFDTKRKSIWAGGIEYGYQGISISDIPDLTVGSIIEQSTETTNATGGTYTYVAGIDVVNSGNAYTVKYSYGKFSIPAAPAPTVSSLTGVNGGTTNASGGTYTYVSSVNLANSNGTYTLIYTYGKFSIPAAPQQTVGSITGNEGTTTNASGGTYTYVAAINVANSGNSYTITYSYGTFSIPFISSLQNMITDGTKMGEYIDNNSQTQNIYAPIKQVSALPASPIANMLYILI